MLGSLNDILNYWHGALELEKRYRRNSHDSIRIRPDEIQDLRQVMLLKADWPTLEFYEHPAVRTDLEKAMFVTIKLAVEYGLINMTEKCEFYLRPRK